MDTKTVVSFGACVGAVATLALPALAQTPPSADKPATTQAVQVTLDYVTATAAQYDRASSKATAGQERDAQLLAALVQGGAKDTKGPRVTVTAGVAGGLTTQSQTEPKLTSFTEIKPTINKDGSITVALTLRQDTLAAGAVATQFTRTILTFHDGQTLRLGELALTDGQTNATTRELIFAKAAVVAPPTLLQPGTAGAVTWPGFSQPAQH